MLILKGENGKSQILESLSQVATVFTYVYYDSQLPFGNIFVNSEDTSLKDFTNTLEQQNKESQESIYNVEYIVVYTNLVEAALFDFITWIKNNEKHFNCKQVIITCK